MRAKFFTKYFSIIFVVAVLLGVLHHHDDLKTHNDCQICTIQSSIADADMPVEHEYITQLYYIYENILTSFASLIEKKQVYFTPSRAPPFIS